MKKITVESEGDKIIAANIISSYLNSHGKCDVVVKKADESLRAKQRGLYWLWVKVICDYNGDTPDDFHRQAKERIFLPVYLRDIDNHYELCKNVAVMKEIRNKIDFGRYSWLRESIINKISHLDATKNNFIDILKQLESEAIDLGVNLPRRDDLYYESMGLKK